MGIINNKRTRTFGFLTVIKRDWTRPSKVYWLCKCRCNNLVSVRSDNLGKGTLSCGCYNKEILLKIKESNESSTFKSNQHRLIYYTYVKPLQDYIKNRDGNKCVLCGNPFDLHIHHILRKSRYPQYLVEPNNLVTLCGSCHLYEAHDGNTNKLNLDTAKELLDIVFTNSQLYQIPEILVTLVKQKANSFLHSN